MAKDLMNTQTGGEGDTVQLQDTSVNNSEQFVSDITPTVTPTQETTQIEQPIVPPATVPTEQEALISTPLIPQISEEEQNQIDIDSIDTENIELPIKSTESVVADVSEFAIPVKEAEPLDFSEFAIPVSNKPIQKQQQVTPIKKKPSNGIYTYTDEDGKENDFVYKRIDDQWFKKAKGVKQDFYKVTNEGSINALDRQWGTSTKLEKSIESQFNPNIAKSEKKAKKQYEEVDRRKFSEINTKVIGSSEEAVVPFLEKKYGDLGFIFSETGVGDAIKVESYFGNEIEINLDNFTDASDNEEALKLRQFLSKTQISPAKLKEIEDKTKDLPIDEFKKQTSKLVADEKLRLYEDFKSDIKNAKLNKQIISETFSEDDFKNTQSLLEQNMSSVYDESNLFESEKKQLEQEITAFNLSVKNNKGVKTPEMIEQENLLNQKIQEVNTKANDIKKKYEDVDSKMSKLKKQSGEYYAIKEKDGSFVGGLVNSFLKGTSATATAGSSLVANILPYFVENAGLDEFEYSKLKSEGLSDQQIRDYVTKQINKDVTSEVAKGNVELLGTDTSEQYIKSEDRGTFTKAMFGLGETLGAIASSPAKPMIGAGAMSYNMVEEEMANIPELSNVSELEKKLVSVPYAIALGWLEKVGFTASVSKNPLAKTYMNRVLSSTLAKLPAQATIQAMEESIKKRISSDLSKGVIRIVGGALAEAETGATQEIVGTRIKEVYDALKGKDYFDNPDFFSMENLKKVGEEALMEAIGGAVMSAGSTAVDVVSNISTKKVDKNIVDLLSNISVDTDLQKIIETDIKSKVVSGEITQQDADNQLKSLEKVKEVISKIPEDFTQEQKKDAFNLIMERDMLIEKVQNKDESLVLNEKVRIQEINNALQNIIPQPKIEGVADNKSQEIDLDVTPKETAKEQITPINEQEQAPTKTTETKVEEVAKQESEVVKEEVEPIGKTEQLETIESPELKSVNSEIETLESKLVTANNVLKEKSKKLDKAINEDAENLFGERKSSDKGGMFDERVDLSQREKATENERAEIKNIEQQLSDLKAKKDKIESGEIASTPDMFADEPNKDEIKTGYKDVDDATDVVELAKMYHDEVSNPSSIDKKDLAISKVIKKVSGESFNRYGDRNIVTQGMARTYFSKSGAGIDQVAQLANQELSGDYSDVEITPDDVVSFITNNPNGFNPTTPSGNPRLKAISEKYIEKTGKGINSRIAKKIADKSYTKEEIEEKNNVLEESIKTAGNLKTLEDNINDEGYWTVFPGGFTKAEYEQIKKEYNEASREELERIEESVESISNWGTEDDFFGGNVVSEGKAEGGYGKKQNTIFEKINSIPSEFKGDENIRDYTVNPDTDIPYKQELRDMLKNKEITQDEFDMATYDIDTKITKYLEAQAEYRKNPDKKAEPKKEKKKPTDKFSSGIDNNFHEDLGWESDYISWEATQRRGEAPRFMDWILSKLGKAFENIEVHTDRGAFLSNAQRLGKNPNIAGFVDSENGVIYLNPDVANENTAFEEYSHVWIELAMQKNPSIIDKGISLLDSDAGKAYIDEIMNDQGYASIHSNKKAVQKEALAKMIADRGYKLSKSKVDKPLLNWIKDFWKSITNALGLTSGKIDINKDSIDTYVDKIAKELLQNKPISLLSSKEFSTFEKGGVGFDIQKSMLDETSTIDKFRVWAKDKFLLGRGAEKTIVEKYNEVKGVIDSYRKRGEFLQKDLQNAVTKYLKENKINTTEQRQNLLTEIDRALKDSLVKDGSYVPYFFNDLGVKSSFLAMRDMVDELSQKLIDSGLIDENSKLNSTIKANMGIYLYKQYKVHLSKDYDWQKTLTTDEQKRVLNWINKKTQVASSVEYKKTKVGRTNQYEITFVNPTGNKSETLIFKNKQDLQNFLDGLTYAGLGAPYKGNVDKLFDKQEGVVNFGSNISMENAGIKMPTMSDAELISIANEMTNKNIKGSTDAQKTLSKQQVSLLMKKSEKDAEYDLLMGAVVDPILNFQNTIIKQADYMFKGELEKYLLENSPELFSAFATPTNSVPITSNQSVFLANKYKSNDGKSGVVYVTPEFYNYMYADGRRTFFSDPTKSLGESKLRTENRSVLMQSLAFFSGLTKKMLTVRSPSSNARNFIGATISMIKSGHFYDLKSPGMMGKLAEDFSGVSDVVAGNILYNPIVSNLRLILSLTQKDKQANRDMILELVEQGLLNSQIDAGVIKDLQEMYINEGQSDKAFIDGFWNKAKSKYKNFSDAENKSYQFSDNLPKAVVYFSLKNTYNDTYGNMYRKQGMSEVEIEKKIKKMASDAVKNQMPTYELSPDIVKSISRNPFIGTFIMYKYQTLRNDGQIFMNTIQLIKDRNEMKRTGLNKEAGKLNVLIAKKISGLAITSLASTGATYIVARMLGFGDDDDEALRGVMPEYRKNNSLLWLSDKSKATGEMTYIDLTNVDPQDNWQKLIIGMKEEQYLDYLEGFIEPYVKPDIGFKNLTNALVFGENDYGMPIGGGNSSGVDFLDKGEYLVDELTKNSIIGQVRNFIKGAKNFTDERGNQFTLANEATSYFLGIKQKTIDVKKAFQSKARSLSFNIEKANDVLKNKIKENDFGAEIERKATIDVANKSIEEGRKMVKGMRVLGMSDDEIRKLLEYREPNSKGVQVQKIKQYVVDKMLSDDMLELDENGEYMKPSSGGSSTPDDEFGGQLDFQF